MSNVDYLQVLGVAGPQTNVTDGTVVGQAMSVTGAVRVANESARLREAASRGKLYCATTAQAGVTIIAEMAGTIAANKKTILSIVNQFGSGIDVVIHKAWITHVTGTPGAGGFAWETYVGLTVPTGTAGNLTTRNTRTGAAGLAQAFSNTALGASAPAHVLLRAFPTGPFARALDGLAPDAAPAIDLVDGEIYLEPGSAASIAAAATGTSHIVMASILYEEVPFNKAR